MNIVFWIAFNAGIVVLLFLDLAVWNRGSRIVPFKIALLRSAFWIAVALAFAVFLHYWLNPTKSLEFITGYLVEEALSVDNLFVFLVLFRFFQVPAEQERTVLSWGILGAMIMRGIFIFAGVTLVRRFHWVLYLFGAFLIYSGFKLAAEGEDKEIDPSRNPVLKLTRKFLPVTDTYEGSKFLVRRGGRILATPLLIVLLVVETTDVLFATDSIPAILAITRDPFIVYTSNVFAILGLRSLYFALSGMMKLFHYLNYGLAAVLVFIGVKMLVAMEYNLPTWITLLVIALILGLSILASLLFPKSALAEEKRRSA